MRKPSPDAGLPSRTPEPDSPATPADASAPPDRAVAAAAGTAGDDHSATTPSLIWPPPEDELHGWEVLQLNSTGHTLIEPMKFDPSPAAAAPVPTTDREESASGDRLRPPSAAAVPAEPSAASGGPAGSDHDAATRIIPVPVLGSSARPASDPHAPPRIPAATRPLSMPPPSPREPDPDETNPGLATRIIPRPAGLSGRPASAPGRPPVSAPATTPPPRSSGVRLPPPPPASMADTLPTAIPRERLAADALREPPKGASPPSPPTSAGEVLIRPATAPPAGPVAPPPRLRTMEPAVAPAGILSGGAPEEARDRATPTFWRIALWALALLLIALVSFQLVRTLRPAAAAPPEATLVVESSPAGAEVLIDGQAKGTTPFRGALAAGAHELEVRAAGGVRRTIPITLAAGTIATHHIELPPPAAVKTDGAIEVRSEPAGARVEIGGRVRGVTPLVVDGLEPGDHRVRVSGPFRAVTRTVTVTAGQQAVLVVTPAPAETNGEGRTEESARRTAGAGYFTIQSPIVLRVVANGEFLGTSEDNRLTLPPGPHVINLENESVGFRDVRTIDVQAGRTIEVPIELPQGAININARPWAEVFVDGRRVGETPVAQLALPIGIHEIVFQHPEHGERRVTAIVKVGTPARAFVDFTR